VNNTEICFHQLQQNGYRIIATDPSEASHSIDEVDITSGKVAIVLGNELRGLSDYALNNCDERVHIPMVGFTESLNISVSAAICLRALMLKINKADLDVGLSEEEKFQLRLAWYRKIVRKSNILEREFLRSIK
jgi:tRNA (guanosine-2'-O-)-methyltransferase